MKAKVYVNESVRGKDHVNGYVNMTPQYEIDISVVQDLKLTFKSTIQSKLSVDKLGKWKQRYLVSIDAWKLHVVENFEGCTVTCGNIVHKNPLAESLDFTIGCFIAVHDEKLVRFEAHFDSPDIFTAKGAAIQQAQTKQTDMMNMDKQKGAVLGAMSKPKTIHGHSKLTAPQRDQIVKQLNTGLKMAQVARNMQQQGFEHVTYKVVQGINNKIKKGEL
ncbi:hypothetical protein GCE9029_01183 [Grimontia celer]|uniref:Uncharacterized protein n=1 Tax=Grimontia celer TaxID=1796497 RepID=A0A128EWN5_9GAMM|nr:hypothetical protein [Grimontia celer]CZF78988.1 hypothetical protein GCE9029_01183 [Grimontia celer]